MPEALFGSFQYRRVVRDDLDGVAKRIECASMRQFHIAKERVLGTAR
jgi:hypothetical protein